MQKGASNRDNCEFRMLFHRVPFVNKKSKNNNILSLCHRTILILAFFLLNQQKTSRSTQPGLEKALMTFWQQKNRVPFKKRCFPWLNQHRLDAQQRIKGHIFFIQTHDLTSFIIPLHTSCAKSGQAPPQQL